MEANLSSDQLQRLTRFLGYGNPSGRFWFMGMEEGGDGSTQELQIRADHFDTVESLARARALVNPGVDLRRIDTSVWSQMCRIVARVNGDEQWRDVGRVKDYLAAHLGGLDGDTFLTEVLPLPKRTVNNWPYEHLWATKDDYVEGVLNSRIALLRTLRQKSNPAYVFCYGKDYWPHHREIFSDFEFETLIDDDAEIGVQDGSVVVLTRFFDPSYQGFTIDFIDTLISAVEERVGVLA
jgi:hypothetical protein